jgi:hypothetical protein
MYRNFNETHLMGEGTREGLAIDKRINSMFVSEGEQNKQILEEQENINKALGYTSYGKYVGFLDYPEDGSNQPLVISTLIYQSTELHTRDAGFRYKILKLILENIHADWKDMAQYNKIINFCFRGNKLQNSNYGVHKP